MWLGGQDGDIGNSSTPPVATESGPRYNFLRYHVLGLPQHVPKKRQGQHMK
jgi:hypothetical protein